MRRRVRSIAMVCFVAVLLLAAVTGMAFREARQKTRNEALIAAIKRNDTKEVIALLRQGADANTRYVPMTPTQIEAAMEQDTWPFPPKRSKPPVSLSRWLLQAFRPQPPPDPTSIPALAVALDVYLECPSDVSLPPRDSRLIKALIEAGADANAKGREGDTPLLLAIEQDRRDIADLLLRRHADPFAKDDYGNTTLMNAAYTGNAELVSRLVQTGIDVNAKDKNGFTALFSAFLCRKKAAYATVKTLLDLGADDAVKDKTGETALTMAKQYASPKIVALLQQKESIRAVVFRSLIRQYASKATGDIKFAFLQQENNASPSRALLEQFASNPLPIRPVSSARLTTGIPTDRQTKQPGILLFIRSLRLSAPNKAEVIAGFCTNPQGGEGSRYILTKTGVGWNIRSKQGLYQN